MRLVVVHRRARRDAPGVEIASITGVDANLPLEAANNTAGKAPKKVLVVQGKLVNVVV